MPQGKPKKEIVCLNNVIGMDSNGEIMLYNLLIALGKSTLLVLLLSPQHYCSVLTAFGV